MSPHFPSLGSVRLRGDEWRRWMLGLVRTDIVSVALAVPLTAPAAAQSTGTAATRSAQLQLTLE